MNILHQITKLPDVLIDIIQTYLPVNKTIFLNKTNYINNHKYLHIDKYIYDNYLRNMVRKDCWFVLKMLLEENVKKWLKMKYTYKNVVYHNYIAFLSFFSIENYSTNCINIIWAFLDKYGITKNQYKNNTLINIRWKT